MDVSVCIVNWNTEELIINCITSLQKKTSGVSYEIIIVDNNSSDGSVEMVRQRFPYCKLIASNKNNGFSKGNNLGFREANGKYILFLNPDTILSTNALLGMFQFMESSPETGAVGCKLLNQDGSIQFTCARTFPTLRNQFCYMMLLNRIFPRSKIFSTIEMGYWNHKDSRYIDCVSGACLFARKLIIEEMKGFDERIFMYAEEVDLCYRIIKKGWKIYYLATEEIYHLEGQSSKKRAQKYFSTLAQRESNRYYFLKHFGKLYAWVYTLIVLFGSFLRLIVMLASIFDFRKNRLRIQDKKYIFVKYFSLLLWSMGLKKAQKS